MRAIIIDDEVKSRKLLRELIIAYCPQITKLDEAETVQKAAHIIRAQSPDLVFLDIEMPEENGFQLFQHFPNFSFDVIFVTAYHQHALKAFEYAAIDYLLKPLDIERLARAVRRVSEHRQRQSVRATPDRMAIPTLNGFKIIAMKDILYCQAERNYTIVKLESGERIVASKNLGKFERLLDGQQFLRIHRSFVVNLRKISQFIRGKAPIIKLTDGTQLEVSSSRKDSLLHHLNIVE